MATGLAIIGHRRIGQVMVVPTVPVMVVQTGRATAGATVARIVPVTVARIARAERNRAGPGRICPASLPECALAAPLMVAGAEIVREGG